MNTAPTDRSYPGKLLLFGEYTVLSGSRALAVPLRRWQGKLQTMSAGTDTNLLGLYRFLEEHNVFTASSRKIFHTALLGGLQFVSDIPRGYGAGSSGALCAAVYEAFFASGGSDGDDDMHTMQYLLADMEGCFHGKSSGMDPLVSLKNAPVLREAESYHLLPGMTLPDTLLVFLIDTGIQRKTDHLVQWYLKESRNTDFKISCLRPLIQSTDHAISFVTEHHLPVFWEHLKLISELQFQYFRKMIPDVIRPHWEYTLDQQDIAIKLCGAGGGGFFLGFARNSDALEAFHDRCALKTVIVT